MKEINNDKIVDTRTTEKIIGEIYSEYLKNHGSGFSRSRALESKERFEKAASYDRTTKLFQQAEKLGGIYPDMIKAALLAAVEAVPGLLAHDAFRAPLRLESYKAINDAIESFLKVVSHDSADGGKLQPVVSEKALDAKLVNIDASKTLRDFNADMLSKEFSLSKFIQFKSNKDRKLVGNVKVKINLHSLSTLIEGLGISLQKSIKKQESQKKKAKKRYTVHEYIKICATCIDEALDMYEEYFPAKGSEIRRDKIVGAFTEILFEDRVSSESFAPERINKICLPRRKLIRAARLKVSPETGS